jgi:cephalosporin hydroxylase
LKIAIDTEAATLSLDGQSQALYSPESFAILSQLWKKTGWAMRYSYDFSWAGRPIIQLPQDVVRLQELVWNVRPDVIIETGVAHGGSTVFFSSLLKAFGGRQVISIDIEIRPHNRAALEAHPFREMYTLIEGSAIAPETLATIRQLLRPEDRVLVILDSNHTKAHVQSELELYAPLVSPGSYIVATDGVMLDLWDVPGGRPEWATDNPTEAAREFLLTHPEFEHDPSYTRGGLTYFPEGYLRRKEQE